MKKLVSQTIITLFKTAVFILLMTIIGALISIAIRGEPGNPTPSHIVTNLRSKGRPFELSSERGRYAIILSFIENNSLFFTPEIAALPVPDLATTNGKYVSLFAPGVSFVAMPFYLLGRSYNLAQVATFAVNSVFALLNFMLITLIVHRLTHSKFAGLISSLVFTFTTVAWVYSGSLYQHHMTTFIFLTMFLLLLGKRHWLKTLLISFLYAVSIFIEYPNAVLLFPLLLWLVSKYTTIEEKAGKIHIHLSHAIFVGILGFVLGLVPSLWYNQNAHGNPLQLTGTLRTVRSLQETQVPTLPERVSYKKKTALGFFKFEKIPQGLDVLLTSKDRGLLFFSPILIFSILGIPLLLRLDYSATFFLGLSCFGLLTLYSMWGDPWGGWAFGPRYLIPLMSMLSIFIGAALAKYKKNPLFLAPFILLFIFSLWINLSGALTTIQIPPSVEQDIKLYPSPTYLHNWQLVTQNISGSFIYNTYFRQLFGLQDFVSIVGAIIVSLLLIFHLGLLFEKPSKL